MFGKLLAAGASEKQTASASSSEVMEASLEDVDLREHMVGILFSRSKLSHLQRQVCAHIVQAIGKETKRVREKWQIELAREEAEDAASDLASESE